MQPTIFLPVIAGPTASGKTGLAVELAKRLDGEVISADSMQIYQGLRIGTARPTEEEMQGVPHHLQGVVPLTQGYSVAQYAEDAHRTIAEVHARSKLPILCGGTGLYIDAVVDNLSFQGEGGDPAIRERLRCRAEQEGAESLLEELRRVDEPTASRLHPNNLGRIIRALELYETTGLTISEQNRQSRCVPSPYRPCFILLDCRDREVLYSRINRRVDAMLRGGLVKEARQALAAPTAPTALQAIGYKELAPYFSGERSLQEAVELLKQSTRRYAKRQLSWFHRRSDAHRLYIDEYTTVDGLAEDAVRLIEGEAHEYLC